MRRELWRHFDFWLFGSVFVLCIFGIVMIRSAIAENVVLSGLVGRQAIYVGIGMGVIIITAMIDYHYWASLTRVMYIGVILLLMVIYVVGTAVYGSARWLDTGLVFVQPSELAKIIMILVLADFFARNRDKPHDLRWVFRAVMLTMGVTIWILLQPNLSTSIVMFVLLFSFMWISGLPPKYLLFFAGMGAAAVMLLMLLVSSGVLEKNPIIKPYQVNRVVNFIFPDPNARHGETYNVEQALITIGSGGLFGQGYGHASQVQLRYLKVRHTDFIFSAMAAEFGFIGTLIIVGLIILVILRCLRAARLASDAFGSLIAYGIATLLFFQTAVNIGVNLNVVPVTGLTLPFISYGGSSLLSLVLGIGLVESVISRHKSLDF
jgi:rod shape determining protein RodA